MTKNLNNNTVYFTVIDKNKFDFKNMMNSKEKLETLQSRYILNLMLNYFGITIDLICKTKLGKPFFKNQNVFFNYSHSNNFIACAISKYNVGIDIEETDRIINDTMVENCNFILENKLEEFVKREAFCKLTGEGIAGFFDKNNFNNIDNFNKTIKNNKYICSICSNCSNPIFQFININKKRMK